MASCPYCGEYISAVERAAHVGFLCPRILETEIMTQLGTPRIPEINGKPKARGAGQPPRKYGPWEWIKGYMAWTALLPPYALLWGLAAVFRHIPEPIRKLLLRWHDKTINSRPQDVRIPGNTATPAYMLRWWKIKRNAYFNTYFHIVKRSDTDVALHDHPWWSFSVVLTGGYYEHTIENGGIHKKVWYGPGSILFRRSGTCAHRLQLPYGGNIGGKDTEQEARTIFITGPVLRRWGFHAGTYGWIDAYEWDEHLNKVGIESNRMEGYAKQLGKK